MFDRTLIPFLATMMAIAMVVTCLIRVESPNGDESRFAPAPWTQATTANPTGSYRFTTNGWEDTTHWRLQGEEAKVKFVDKIHPLVFALIVVLVAFGLAVLASDEKNVERLWPGKVE